MIKKLSLILVFLLTACIYRLDIQQGNILAQRDIDKLRPGLTKNQVVYVLGSPVIDDSFSDDKWVYLYTFTNKKTEINTRKKLELWFEEDKLVTAKGDYKLPEVFNEKSTKE